MTHMEYGGEAVVVKKLPTPDVCCKQRCEAEGYAEWPTQWCNQRKTVCVKTDKCKEYEYRYYDSPRCAEWSTHVVQTPRCIAPVPITFNTGRCLRYEKKCVAFSFWLHTTTLSSLIVNMALHIGKCLTGPNMFSKPHKMLPRVFYAGCSILPSVRSGARSSTSTTTSSAPMCHIRQTSVRPSTQRVCFHVLPYLAPGAV